MLKKAKRIISGILSASILAGVMTFGGTVGVSAASVSITESAGWLESAYVEWSPVSGATGYNVYVKKSGGSYVQLDDSLIRAYSGYYRADALGLTAGSYTMKVVPVINGSESGSGETSTLTVKAHTREGFAFTSESTSTGGGSTMGSGAYVNNGTLPSDAQVIYVTDDNKDSVTLDVIKDSKGNTYSCTGLYEILQYRQKGYDKTPLAIRLIGKVTSPNGVNSSGYMQLKGCYNITMEGVGEDATIYGWGILIRNATNVEIRNLGIMYFPDDGVSLDTSNVYCWIHNNDFFYGQPGSDSDQVKGDGSCDVKSGSTNITISYNHFWDSGKCSLCGMKSEDADTFKVTYHHNWFDHSDSRHPRIRTGSVHIYNNYFDGNAKYGVGMTMGGSAFVENNYFRNCKYPMLISMQGSDIASGNGNFSSEDGGIIKAYNNYMTGQKAYVTYSDSSTSFDAYEVSSKSATVPSSVKAKQGSTTYNNFDTSSSMYSYSADTPANALTNVKKYAGRINGGDFQWTFTTDDDSDYSVNSELKSAIASYKTSLVSVGGLGTTGSGSSTAATTTTTTTTEAATETTTAASSSSSTSTSWNFGDSAFKSLGTISSNTTVNGLGLIATSSKTMSVKSASETLSGTTYSYCLALGGTGSTSYRAVKVPVSGSDTIKITLKSSGSSDRTLVVADESGNQLGTVTAPSSIALNTYSYSGNSGYVYIYSSNSGINLYKIQVDSKGTITAETTTEATTESENETVIADGWYYIKSTYSNLYLQAEDNTGGNGQNVNQGTGTGVSGQKWYLTNTSDGYFTLKNGTGYMLDVPNGENNDGVNIALWENNDLDPQRFKAVEISSGVYGIVTKISGDDKCLDIYEWDTSDASNICQWTYYANLNQQWKFESCN